MNNQNKGLDIERVKQIALDNGFQLKEQASGNYDLHSYVYQFAEKLLEDKQAEINELKAKLAKYEDPSPENLIAFSHAMYRRLASWAGGQIPKELSDLKLNDFVPMYAASAAVCSLKMDWTIETTHVIVPKQPTEEQYGGLARDLVRYLQMCKRWSPLTLTTHLKQFGIDMPEWLKEEVPNPESDHHFAKGDIVALIYKAALYGAPQHQPQGENHEQQ